MKKYLVAFQLLLVIPALSQDTIYFDEGWDTVATPDQAYFMRIITCDPVDTNRVAEKTFLASSFQMTSERHYSHYKKCILDGESKEWFDNGRLSKDIVYAGGVLNGRLLTYWNNGNPKRIDQYENGILKEGKCFGKDGNEIDYFRYEQLPEYPGGLDMLIQFLKTETSYPTKARRKGITGTVMVSFSVGKDGVLTDIKIQKSVHEELDRESIRVVKKMPPWKPGILDGEPVVVKYNLPLKFSLR